MSGCGYFCMGCGACGNVAKIPAKKEGCCIVCGLDISGLDYQVKKCPRCGTPIVRPAGKAN